MDKSSAEAAAFLSYTRSRRRTYRACTAPRLTINYTSVLLAVLAGILHAGLAPVILVAGVKPNLVLVGVVLVTCLFGFLPGIVWAFVAGVVANLLVPEPLGSIPLTMLAVAALTAGGQRIFGRLPWLYPILAAIAGSVLADVMGLAVFQLVAEPVQVGVPMELVLPAAVLNAALVGLLLVPARVAARRYGPEEAAAW